MSARLAFGRLRQIDCHEFKARLKYSVKPCLRTLSKYIKKH